MAFINTRLGKLILQKSFVVIENRLYLTRDGAKLVLPVSEYRKFFSSNITHLSIMEIHDKSMFAVGDYERIMEVISPDFDVNARIEAKAKQTLKAKLQSWYQYLQYYTYLPEIDTWHCNALAYVHAFLFAAAELRQNIDSVLFLLSDDTIIPKEYRTFVTNLVLSKSNSRTITSEEDLPQIILPEAKHTLRLYHKTIPPATLVLLQILDAQTKENRVKYLVMEQMLVNIFLDNPNIDRNHFLLLSTNCIQYHLEYRSIEERDKTNKLGTLGSFGCDIILQPLEVVCLACYTFNLEAENTHDIRKLLIVYDHATKFIIHKCELTGLVEEFMAVLKTVLQISQQRVPLSFWYDPDLSTYIAGCSGHFKDLGVVFTPKNCINIRLSFFLKYFVPPVLPEYSLQVEDEQKKEYRIKLVGNFDKNDLFTLVSEHFVNQFNQPNKKESSGDPVDCFKTVSSKFKQVLSELQFAFIFYRFFECHTNKNIAFLRNGDYIYTYRYNARKQTALEPAIILINTENFATQAFIVKGEIVTEAEYNGKYLDDGQRDAMDNEPIIIDVRKEIAKLKREQFDIPKIDMSTNLFFEEKSRRLRKLFFKYHKRKYSDRGFSD